MSERINDIIDVDVIEKQINDTIKALSLLHNKFADLVEQAGKFSASLSDIKGLKDATKAGDDYVKIKTQINKARSEEQRIIDQVNRLADRQIALMNDESKAQLTTQERIRENIRLTTAQAKARAYEEGSVKRMQQEVAALRKQYYGLSAEQRANADIGGKMAKELADKTVEFNRLKIAVGDTSSNIGNYQQTIEGALVGSNKFAGALLQMAKNSEATGQSIGQSLTIGAASGKKALTALMAHPFILGFAVIAKNFKRIVDFVKDLIPAQQRLNELHRQHAENLREINAQNLKWEESAIERQRLERIITSQTATQEEILQAINDLNDITLEDIRERIRLSEIELEIEAQKVEVENKRISFRKVWLHLTERGHKVELENMERLASLDKLRANIAQLKAREDREQANASDRLNRNEQEQLRIAREQLAERRRISAEIQRQRKEQQKIAEQADKTLRDLRISLITDDFDREKAQLLAALDDASAAVIGTTEQRQQQIELLEQKHKQNMAKLRQQFIDDQIAKGDYLLQNEISQMQHNFELEIAAIRMRENDRDKIDADIAKKRVAFAQELTAIQIAELEKALQNEEISEEKRYELNKRLTGLIRENELMLANENVRLNDLRIADEERVARELLKIRQDITKQSIDLGRDVIDALIEGQQRALDAELGHIKQARQASNDQFKERENHLKNAVMTDERRAMEEAILAEEKAQRDAELAREEAAIKRRQAEWDKRNALIQTAIATAMAVAKASPVIPLMALAAATGAVQLALIASKQIPAFEKGGIASGWALWGEKRPEVAVSKSGDVQVAYTPTITDFEPGTKIYPSIEKYNQEMARRETSTQAVIDYGEIQKRIELKQQINLDSRGLWGIILSQGARTSYINKEIKL